MKTITGIFRSRERAEYALQEVRSVGLLQEQLSLLTPGISAAALDAVPTTDTEQPGMGKALGAVAGGATGLSGGVLGAAVASLFLPGVGPLMVLGAAALGGVIGAVAGAGVGDTLEEARAHAYEACERISFPGAHYRRDIAAKAVNVAG